MRGRVKWMLVVLLVAAAGMSMWLTVEKFAGRINSLAGCGAGSGCANVLGSKWSVVFGVFPVSLFSLVLYIAVLASLWMDGSRVRWFRVLAAWMFLGAAVWFTALQLFVLHVICPYCMTMHGLGVVLGVLILCMEYKERGVAGRFVLPLLLAVVMVAALAAVQYLGSEPASYRVDDVTGVSDSSDGDAHSLGAGRAVLFFGGKKSYRVNELPRIGSAEAEYVVVEYFDYTCEACGEMRGYLDEVVKKHPGEIAVIVLPVPLNRSCNAHLPKGMEDHENACELARLALRVWRADRTKFPEFHTWLFEYHTQPIEVAEAMAYSLVGEEKMAGVDEVWVDALLRQNVEDYKVFVQTTPVMPKLLIKGSKMIQGKPRDVESLERVLNEYLNFKK